MARLFVAMIAIAIAGTAAAQSGPTAAAGERRDCKGLRECPPEVTLQKSQPGTTPSSPCNGAGKCGNGTGGGSPKPGTTPGSPCGAAACGPSVGKDGGKIITETDYEKTKGLGGLSGNSGGAPNSR